MKLVCFPREMAVGYDDGTVGTLLPFAPEVRSDGNLVLDPDRVYLALEETVQGLISSAIQHRLPQPVRFASEIMGRLPSQPRPLTEILAQPPQRQVRVCLINGGGGGLGDGILFAPALRIISQRLQALTGAVPQLVAYSMLPQRTTVVLSGIPGLQVRPMPMTLAEFMGYDAVANLSGMLDDPQFQQAHMTDFVLARLGIDPAVVPAVEKAPCLCLPSVIPNEVAVGLGKAYAAAAGKPLVAVIFISSYTRSLPEPKAAALIRRLAEEGYQPVLMFPEDHSALAFLARQELQGVAVDISAASRSFLDYFMLLAGMDAIVTVDTSAVHIGAALNKPTVALFNSINMEYRIRYSPSVHGIQLVYQGRSCQAPCGLSKSRAFIQGKLSNGEPFRLECGYACDEAVARDEILDEAGAAMARIDPTVDISPQINAIRQRMADRLHAALSPCWENLDEETVVRGLRQMMQPVASTAERTSEVMHVGAE